MQNLADAANLEDALIGEDLERIDLTALIQSYLNNLNVVRPGQTLFSRARLAQFMSAVLRFRIENC